MDFELTATQTDHGGDLLRFLESQRNAIPRLLPDGLAAILREHARYENVSSSARIEGNRLALGEAVTAIAGDSGSTASEDGIQVRQLNEAYELAYQFTQDREARIDGGIIRALHSVLLKNSPDVRAERARGAYRLGEVGIQKNGVIVYTAPPALDVPGLMDSLLSTLRNALDSDMPGVLAAAYVHFGLVSIHPFDDGNGRLARLLADMTLDLTGWSFDRTVTVNSAILARLDDYYSVLQHVQGPTFKNPVDISEFVEFHFECMRDAIERLHPRIDEIHSVIEAAAAELGGDPRAHRLTQAILYMNLVDDRISTSTYARLNDCSQPTAGTDLQLLLQTGRVERIGAGRSTRYRWTGTPMFTVAGANAPEEAVGG